MESEKSLEFKIKRHVTEYPDGSKTCWEALSDDYGMSLWVKITFYDKNGEMIGEPWELLGP